MMILSGMGIDPISAMAASTGAAQGIASIISLFKDDDAAKDTAAAATKIAQINAASEAAAGAQRTQLVVTTLVGAGALLVAGILLYGAVKGKK